MRVGGNGCIMYPIENGEAETMGETNTAGRWDNEAKYYQKTYALENDYNRLLLDFLRTECGLAPGCRVIDIGCGVGKYGASFAKMGCDVTLTDISPAMLEYAGENMRRAGGKSWRTLCCDWNAVSTDIPELCSGFDLAVSTMSPAICGAASIAKMSAVTRGWCFVARFCDWDAPLERALSAAAGLEYAPPFAGDGCAELPRWVAEAGYTPLTAFRDYCWSDERTPEEAAGRFFSHRGDGQTPDAALEEAVLGRARSLADGRGLVSDAVNARVLWLRWRS